MNNSFEKQINKVEALDKSLPMPHSKFIQGRELLLMQFSPELYLVDRLVPLGGLTLISGQPGSMKSYLLHYIAIQVGNGSKVFGYFEVKQAKVLIIDKENMPRTVKRRLQMLSEDKTVEFPTFMFRSFWPDFDIANIEHARELIQYIKTQEIKLVCFDSLVRFFNGAEENSSTETAQVFANIKKIQDVGCSICVIVHERKPSLGSKSNAHKEAMIRGSSNIFAEADAHFSIEKKMDIDGSTLTITQCKNRDEEELPPFDVKVEQKDGILEFIHLGNALSGKEKTDREVAEHIITILRQFPEGLYKADIITAVKSEFECGDKKIDAGIKLLLNEKRIINKAELKNKARYFIHSANPVTQISSTDVQVENCEPEVTKIAEEYSIDDLVAGNVPILNEFKDAKES